ncbi:MAG TPA: hypothetical protein VIF83_00790 [Gemmatimonadaceae bacterium]|jgi:energy-coupling factor transporter ATP-binding protein EcfA2
MTGAIWKRVDFHLHTPGVESFSYPSGADALSEKGRRKVSDQYAQQLLEQGVALAAITDYNGIREGWFNSIREFATLRSIVLFPGAEVSLRVGKLGLHVLAIFPFDTDAEAVNSYLQAQDRDPATPLFDEGNRTHREIDTKGHPVDMLVGLRDRFGCLLIPPHPNQSNGICKTMKAKDAAEFLRGICPDALEHCPESEIKKLVSTGRITPEFFRNLAMVEFSDPRSISEIGTKSSDGNPRATFLKLSSYDLSAVRLALHDPAMRVRTGTAPLAQHTRITRLKVSGAFLGDLTIEFNDELNVLVGGRGVGKSALLEVLRYALEVEPIAESEYREGLVKSALGSGGSVEVTLSRFVGSEKDERYRIRRVYGQAAEVYDARTKELLDVSPADAFGPDRPLIFGQREIYEISLQDERRLALLDELIGHSVKDEESRIEEIRSRIASSTQALRRERQRLAKRDELRDKLKAIEHELKVYAKHGAAQKLGRFAALSADEGRLQSATEAIEALNSEWADFRESFVARLNDAQKPLELASSDKKSLLESASRSVATSESTIVKAFDNVTDSLLKLVSLFEKTSDEWLHAKGSLQDQINAIKKEAQAERLDADRLLKLKQDQAKLSGDVDQLSQAESRSKSLGDDRRKLLNELREQRLNEYRIRRDAAERIGEVLKGRLRIAIDYKGQKSQYRAQLTNSLKGSGVSADAIGKLVTPDSTDGMQLAIAVRGGAPEIERRFDLSPAMASRVVEFFDEDRIFDLETLIPDDLVDVELRVEEGYVGLAKLSAGQRATAILLLLFALQGRPLILDQPEDDLDNRFIYEDVVQILRSQKVGGDSARQLIVASHNANIPVLGDAEQVLVLGTADAKATVVHASSIDDVRIRELVKSVMEGGEEAFRRRAEKYAGMRTLG